MILFEGKNYYNDNSVKSYNKIKDKLNEFLNKWTLKVKIIE